MDKFFDQVSGVVKVNIKGKRPEKVLNMALSRGIYIWGIKNVNNNIECKVRSSSIEALKSIADEADNEIITISAKGLPFWKGIIKRRLGFITGSLIFILALYFLSSFVWFVNVSGNENVKREQLLLTAAKYGVYQGAAKWSFSKTEVEEAILRDIDNLTYAKLDIRGVKANIEVVEKVLPKSEITGPSHVVATKDGVIEDVLVLAGKANVEKDQVVQKGDILISGVFLPDENPLFSPLTADDDELKIIEPTLVRARGIVKAKVWYYGYGECQLEKTEIKRTGSKQTEFFLITPKAKSKLFCIGKKDFTFADEEEILRELVTPFGKIALARTVRFEKVQDVKKHSEKEALDIARDKAISSLNKKLKDKLKVNTTNTEVISAPSELILRVKVSMEVTEDIGEAQPINVE